MKPNRKSRLTGWLSAVLASAVAFGASNCNREHPPLTPVQEEALVISSLEKSGPVPAVLEKILEPKATDLWNTTFGRGFDNLGGNDKKREVTDRVKVGSIACFKAGCMVKVWYKDLATVTAFEENLLVGPDSPLRRWPGRIYRGSVIEDRSQGGVLAFRATWALMVIPSRYKELAALSTIQHASAEPAL